MAAYDARGAQLAVPAPDGTRYETQMSDTLDLAARCNHALHALIGMTDTDLDHEIWFHSFLGDDPPWMYHDTAGMPTNSPKFPASYPLMRVATVNDRNLDVERDMMSMMVRNIGDDCLFYAI